MTEDEIHALCDRLEPREAARILTGLGVHPLAVWRDFSGTAWAHLGAKQQRIYERRTITAARMGWKPAPERPVDWKVTRSKRKPPADGYPGEWS